MRWNCPHCGVGLNVADDQLGEGWCFSKCYQCSGFSLVRRSDSGAVRVDGTGQTGAGLPRAASLLDQSPWKLSQRAIDAAQKPMIRPARARVQDASKASAIQQISKDIQENKVTLPPPFKAAATASGMLQQQQTQPVGLMGRSLPPPLPEAIETTSSRLGRVAYRVVTRTIALSAFAVVGYGAFIWVTTPIPVATNTPTTLARVTSVVTPVESTPKTLAIQAPSLTQAVVTDSISRGAMAPDRQKETQNQLAAAASLEIEALSPRVQLRSGPGTQYSVVGTVTPAHKYSVADWSERWFRIVVEKNADGSGKSFAWVRNDLVKLVKKSR